LQSLDSQLIKSIIQEIAVIDDGVAVTLDQLAGNFDYPAIIEMLDKVMNE
jgi:hypothetical protein